MTAEQACIAIRAAWGAWAMRQIGEEEFAARVSEALEGASFLSVGPPSRAANDGFATNPKDL